MVRDFHDFYAPVGGRTWRFTMRLDNDQVANLASAWPWADGIEMTVLRLDLDVVNQLLAEGLPWAALAAVRSRRDLGAVIEAAEARRREIYGLEGAA